MIILATRWGSVTRDTCSWRLQDSCFQVENIISTYEPQACMVVYSIIDKDSYAKAEETLQYLETQSSNRRAKILVRFYDLNILF